MPPQILVSAITFQACVRGRVPRRPWILTGPRCPIGPGAHCAENFSPAGILSHASAPSCRDFSVSGEICRRARLSL